MKAALMLLAACLAVPVAGAAPVDPATVPVSKATLPAFPFVQLPKESPQIFHESEINWDRVHVLAGSQIRPVEGRYRIRNFSVQSAGLTTDKVLQHYEREIGALGGVKLATLKRGDTALLPAEESARPKAWKKLGQIGSSDVLDQYLIRTPGGNVWIGVSVFDDGLNGSLVVVQEQPFKPSVSLLKHRE